MKRSKVYRKKLSLIPKDLVNLEEGIKILKELPKGKFDESLDIYFKLGIDTRQSTQLVRNTVELPHGTGRSKNICVICEEKNQEIAKKSGADKVGGDELVEEIKKGKLNFDILITTLAMMPKIRILGKILGPKGLMPNPKTGTVTNDIAKAVSSFKAGRVEYRVDKGGAMAVNTGKISFSENKLKENIVTIIEALKKDRPTKLKGDFICSCYLSLTMGPSVKINYKNL